MKDMNGGNQEIRVSGCEYQDIRKSGLNITLLNQCKTVSKKEGYLKKQSQFAGGHIGVNFALKGSYGYMSASWARKNKPNQTQSWLAPRSSGR